MKSTFLIALLLGGSGVALISEQSVPGDFLYPVKLNVNENIRHALAIGSVAEARLALALLQERLREVEILAEKGELDDETTASVRAAINAQATIVEEKSGSMTSRNEQLLREELTATLEGFRVALVAYQTSLSSSTIESLQTMTDEVSQTGVQTPLEVAEPVDNAVIEELAAAIVELEAQEQALASQTFSEAQQIQFEEISLSLVKAKSAFASGEYQVAQEHIEETKQLIASFGAVVLPTPEDEIPTEDGEVAPEDPAATSTADEAI